MQVHRATHLFGPASLVIAVLALPGAFAFAEESVAPEKPAMPAGLVPLPDYTGRIFDRAYLSGDWGGTRTDLANKGVQFEVDFTQYFQGVTQGGSDTGARYGGSLDYLLNVDLHRMGVMPGALVTVRAESRYGDAANDISGSVLPVNTEGFFPLTDHLDDDIAITVTTFRYLQFLGEHLGFMLGKFDTLDSTNEFAAGRGVSQFMNGGFIFSPAGAVTVPYSTLGAGVIISPIKNLTVSSVIMNTRDSSTTPGFEDIGEGWTSLSALGYQYRLMDLPGGVNVAGAYAADSQFQKIGGGLVFDHGEGLTLVKENSSWFVTADAWQYIWLKEPAKEGAIHVADGRQHLQGIGLFTRVGFADKDTNPIEYALSGGVAAKGLIPTRDNDTMGVAYGYNRIQKTRFSDVMDIQNHSQFVEVFYNIALTPATHLTLDLQVAESALNKYDTAVILGARLNLKF